MNKKIVSLIGLGISGVIVLLGLLVLTGALTGNTTTASSALYPYDSGYATFGADFYSYVSNNAQEAASAGRTTAANVHRLFQLIRTVSGLFLMGFGALNACSFMLKFLECQGEKPAAPAFVPAAPVEEPAVPAEEPAAPVEEAAAPAEAPAEEPAAEPTEDITVEVYEEPAAPAEKA